MGKGEQIVLEGCSDQKLGSQTGDVIFEIQEKKHPIFKRRKKDHLLMKYNISLVEAITGHFSIRIVSSTTDL